MSSNYYMKYECMRLNLAIVKLSVICLLNTSVSDVLSVDALVKGVRRTQMVPAGAKSKHFAC